MAAWLGEHGLACRRVAEPGGPTVALTCEVPGGRPGPRFVLDACLDTAPFGALPDGSPLRDALLKGATRAGLAPVAKVAGPSNIGNYLAGLGIPATGGFGVDYKNLHGTDERIRLDSIPAVQAAYHQALLTFLHAT
jgi:acetylornithine deacetylase/succinyl-diaminopimelate desuccinylase-like protein